MFERLNYSRKVLVIEILVVIVSVISTLLLDYIQGIQEYYLRCFTKAIIAIIDVCVNIGLMVTVQLQGGIVVFYLFKTILILFAHQHSILEVIFPALACYMVFKIGGITLVRVSKLDELNYRSLDERSKFIENEQKRRIINIGLLFICLMFILFSSLSKQSRQIVPFVASITLFLCTSVQLFLMSGSVGLRFKLISTSLAYNIYGIVALIAIAGKIYHDSYIYFAQSLLAYLLTFFFFIRIFIGNKSSKFHSADSKFFDASYIFKGDNGHKYYREKNDWQRTLKVMDRVSRELLVVIYYLSFFVAVQLHLFSYLFISVYLMNSYPVLNSNPLKIISYLQSKLNMSISLKPKLTIPILVTFYLIVSKEKSREEYLYDEINHCVQFIRTEVFLMILLVLGCLVSQFLSEDKKRVLLRVVELGCPLVVFGWVMWLECLHFKAAILGGYVLAFCVQALSMRTKSQKKGIKQN